jgi:hypothetical protein
MEDFALPSIGASFKKWECYTPILPKCQVHPHNTKKRGKKNAKNAKKGGCRKGPQSVRLLIASRLRLGALN